MPPDSGNPQDPCRPEDKNPLHKNPVHKNPVRGGMQTPDYDRLKQPGKRPVPEPEAEPGAGGGPAGPKG
ncbi:MAG: hypothetical protein H5U17_06995 [Defluviimonas sp.]|nr:hypothetical protein [Defluviimonas sp.]